MTPTLVPRSPKGSAGARCRGEASSDGEVMHRPPCPAGFPSLFPPLPSRSAEPGAGEVVLPKAL